MFWLRGLLVFALATSALTQATPQRESELSTLADRLAQDVKSARKHEMFPKLLVIDFADERGRVNALGEHLADVLSDSLAERLGPKAIIGRKQFRDYLLSAGISPFDLQDSDVARWTAGRVGVNLLVVGHLRPLGAATVALIRVSDQKELSNVGTVLSLTEEMKALSNEPLNWPTSPDVVVPCVDTRRGIVDDGVRVPVCIRCPPAIYTDEARKAKYQGNVKLKVVIDQTGHARSATIIKGAPAGLDDAAATAVKKWSFQPATKDGKPVVACVPIEITFRLY